MSFNLCLVPICTPLIANSLFASIDFLPTMKPFCGNTNCRNGRTSTWTLVRLLPYPHLLHSQTHLPHTSFLVPLQFYPGTTYPNGLAAGSINASGGVKNPIASGSSNKSSIVSVKNPPPSAPSAKDEYDFDSMQVHCALYDLFLFLRSILVLFSYQSFFPLSYCGIVVNLYLLFYFAHLQRRSTRTLMTKTKGCVL